MSVFIEQRLRFEFGPSWERVEQYDAHKSYRGGIERLKGKALCEECQHDVRCAKCQRNYEVGTRAVDFVATYRGRLHLIEVKDFRRHRIENKRRLREGDLALEVAFKVRDTLAGLVGALHRDAGNWQPLVASLLRQPPKVLLWLEEDDDVQSRLRQRGHPTLSLGDSLRKVLGWMSTKITADVAVVNQKTLGGGLDLRVRDLPDNVYEVRTIVNRSEPRGISGDAFRDAWGTAPQAAGEALAKLCRDGVLVFGKKDWYAPGPTWDSFHEAPSEKST